MTREEAIRHLEDLQRLYLGNEKFTADVEAIGIAIKALEQIRWIPVSERLPEDGQNVLFCDIDNDIMIGYHVKGRPNTHFSQDGTWEDMKNVRAWMPLPQPYKAESEEKIWKRLK